MSPTRPRHPDKSLEALLRSAEGQGWRAVKGKGYFKILCPCPDKHKKMIHLTPGPHYEKHTRQWLSKYTCWEEDQA